MPVQVQLLPSVTAHTAPSFSKVGLAEGDAVNGVPVGDVVVTVGDAETGVPVGEVVVTVGEVESEEVVLYGD